MQVVQEASPTGCGKIWDGQHDQAEHGGFIGRRRGIGRATTDGSGSAPAIMRAAGTISSPISDRNVNYTNVCNVYCKFCAFYRTEKDDDSYVITHEEMDRKIEETVALGGTQILMQGGHHPKLTKQWYLDLLAHIKAKFPEVNIHGFSPSEFIHFREVFNEPVETILRDFVKAGLGLQTIRLCLAYARECVSDPRPFSTRRFQTDGRTIDLGCGLANVPVRLGSMAYLRATSRRSWPRA